MNVIINDFENHINWTKASSFSVKEKKGLGQIEAFYKHKDKFEEIEYNNSLKIDTLWLNYKVYNSELSDLTLDIEYLNIEFTDDFILSSIDSLQFDINLIQDKSNYKNNVESEKLVDRDQILIT